MKKGYASSSVARPNQTPPSRAAAAGEAGAHGDCLLLHRHLLQQRLRGLLREVGRWRWRLPTSDLVVA
jgi:hypothetical protein